MLSFSQYIAEGIFKPHQGILDKPFSATKKRTENTPAEYQLLAKGSDFEVYANYGGSLKRQVHVVVRDDKIIGSGWTMPSALKDAKLKKSDVKHYSKFADGSHLNTMKESRDKNYSVFPIYGELKSSSVVTKPLLSGLKIKNKLLSLGGSKSPFYKTAVSIKDKNALQKIDKWLLSNGFRKESDEYAKQKINQANGEKIYGTYVFDQKVAVPVNGTVDDKGTFSTKWPYPDNGDEKAKLLLTVETVVVIQGRNTAFDEELIYNAHIFAPGSDIEKEAKSGSYRFSFKRDMIGSLQLKDNN